MTYLKIAKAYEMQDNTAEAIKNLTTALGLATGKEAYGNIGPSIHFSLGKLYMKEGMKPETDHLNKYTNISSLCVLFFLCEEQNKLCYQPTNQFSCEGIWQKKEERSPSVN